MRPEMVAYGLTSTWRCAHHWGLVPRCATVREQGQALHPVVGLQFDVVLYLAALTMPDFREFPFHALG